MFDIELNDKAWAGLENLKGYMSIKLEFRLYDGKEIRIIEEKIDPEDMLWFEDNLNKLLGSIPPVKALK